MVESGAKIASRDVVQSSDSDTYESLDIKSLGRLDRADVLLGERSEDSGLTCVIAAKNQDPGLARLLFEDTQLAEKSH